MFERIYFRATGICISSSTTQDSLGRSVVINSTLFRKPNGTHSRPVAGSGAKDAELRDRSAPDVCSIATLRGPLL